MFILGLYLFFYLVFTGFVLSLYLECTGSVGVCTRFVLGLYLFALDFFTGFVTSSGSIHAEFVLGVSCVCAVFMLDSCLVCAGLY